MLRREDDFRLIIRLAVPFIQDCLRFKANSHCCLVKLLTAHNRPTRYWKIERATSMDDPTFGQRFNLNLFSIVSS